MGRVKRCTWLKVVLHYWQEVEKVGKVEKVTEKWLKMTVLRVKMSLLTLKMPFPTLKLTFLMKHQSHFPSIPLQNDFPFPPTSFFPPSAPPTPHPPLPSHWPFNPRRLPTLNAHWPSQPHPHPITVARSRTSPVKFRRRPIRFRPLEMARRCHLRPSLTMTSQLKH